MSIILDIDPIDPALRAELLKVKAPGVWGYKLGDEILRTGLQNAMCPLGKKRNIMIDLKHYDVRGRIGRMVALYAELGEYAPKFLTISGRCGSGAIEAAVKARGPVQIIVTTILSDDDDATSRHGDDEALDLVLNALSCGAQGVTCPAWILPAIDWGAGFNGPIVATGVVSDDVDPRHHVNPRPIEFALEHGATHVVVGTEVTSAPNPVDALMRLSERAMACNKRRRILT